MPFCFLTSQLDEGRASLVHIGPRQTWDALPGWWNLPGPQIVKETMRATTTGLVAVLLLSACGQATDPSGRLADKESSSKSPTARLDEIPYECAGADFDPAAFRPGDAEQGSSPKATALRQLLELHDAQWMPRTGWVEVAANENKATFISKGEAGDFYNAIITRDSGPWSASGWGGCTPRAEIVGGSIVEWSLDPTAPDPTPDDTIVAALINEIACHSFKEPTDRMREPNVMYEADRVLVVLTADPLRGFQTCPGTAPVPFELELPGPLGDRTLYDAGTYPPRPADKRPRAW